MTEDYSITTGLQRESVDEALGHILSVLDIIAGLALKEETYDKVADEELRLGMIISKAQLILDDIAEHRPPKIGAMQ